MLAGGNTILYENALPGIDLEYITDPYMVKENIRELTTFYQEICEKKRSAFCETCANSLQDIFNNDQGQ